jgi:hypothetical protein
MSRPINLQARRFQRLVASYLELAPDSSDLTVRKALRSKGLDFIEWYDTRLRAIAEAPQTSPKRTRSRSRLIEMASK